MKPVKSLFKIYDYKKDEYVDCETSVHHFSYDIRVNKMQEKPLSDIYDEKSKLLGIKYIKENGDAVPMYVMGEDVDASKDLESWKEDSLHSNIAMYSLLQALKPEAHIRLLLGDEKEREILKNAMFEILGLQGVDPAKKEEFAEIIEVVAEEVAEEVKKKKSKKEDSKQEIKE